MFDYSDTWQLVINTGTTIVTFLMVFLIQRAQNKDARAIHLKLNELIASLRGPSNRLVDVEELTEKELDDGVFIFSTRLDVEYLNQTYKLNIPESDSYGTLGGFIVDSTKEIPQKGDVITIGIYHFIIEEATNKKIELVKMTIKD